MIIRRKNEHRSWRTDVALVLMGVCFFVLAALVLFHVTDSLDRAFLSALEGIRSGSLTEVVKVVTDFAGLYASVGILAAVGVSFAFSKQYDKAVILACIALAATLIGLAIKVAVARNRPDVAMALMSETGSSFPSRHAVTSSAIGFGIIALLWSTKWRLVALLASVLYVVGIGFTRLYLAVHFPTDIIGAWLLSGVVVIAAMYILGYYNVRKQAKAMEDK